MLQRSLTRSLESGSPARQCAICVCSCGRSLGPTRPFSTTQRRHRRLKASPSVPSKKGHRVITAQEKEEQRLQEESDHDWHIRNIARGVRLGLVSGSIETVVDFLNHFAALCDANRYSRPGAIPVNKQRMEELIAAGEFQEHDFIYMAQTLLVSPKEDQKVYGKKLLYSLSHLGYEGATITIMKQVLVEAKHSAEKLRASEAAHPRKHLTQMAHTGKDFRAMVLEGRVEYMLGNQDAAIRLWTGALDGAVAYGRKPAAEKNDDTTARRLSRVRIESGLDTPWIELSSILIARQEWAKAREAIRVGCEMDDPTAHYFAATLEKKTDADGQLVATSAWLYHMTKAAASSHPKAAHELGNFYGYSGWPYLEDEPPDEIKPTPFDRYPPENPDATRSLWNTIRQVFTLTPKKREDPRLTVFKTAHFPMDPVGRMRMALAWLEIATSHSYAPSHLLAANLHLEKTLWHKAATPRAAEDLTPARYTAASKAEYDARGLSQTEEDYGEDIPNPFYAPKVAYAHIRRVFHAHTAQRAQLELKARIARIRKSGSRLDPTDIDSHLTESGMEGFRWAEHPTEVSAAVRAFYRFPEVREMYSDDRRGVIFDDTGSERVDLYEAAKGVCEEMGWDVFDEGGELMYKHGMGQQQQQQPPQKKAAAAGAR